MISSIVRGKKDMPDQWLEPEKYKTKLRLHYIKSIQSHIPTKCPHCNTILEVDEEQVYCPQCGLVTQDSYNYQAGQRFTLPHGLKLI